MPDEIKGWNWAAFILNWMWGIGNKVYIALLCFIPVVGIVMIFVLGIKGNEWAWKNKKWESIDHFRRVQKVWTYWALVALGLLTISFLFGFFRAIIMFSSSN